MKQEIVCPCPTGNVVLGTESVPFSEIPHQSKLFIEYQKDPAALREFYPNAIVGHTDISSRIGDVLANYKADRSAVCDVLEQANRAAGAGDETIRNITLLRDGDCVAVVSGQQAGLFSGPLYTIYKALSAVKHAECLRGRGFKAVPVFWIATEDHDFLEVSNTFVIDKSGDLAEVRNEPKRCYENLPVGYVKLDGSIKQTIDELFRLLPHTEFTDELRAQIEETWASGVDYGDAFARLMTRLMGKYGLILLCPLDERLKRIAEPIYSGAIEHAEEIVARLRERSALLVQNGYHAQVLIEEDYFPLFWQAKNRTRHALKKTAEGTYKAKDLEREFTREELAAIARAEPHRFSPSVVLRSVVQDYILPTVCYYGGAAEIAYFAQSAEVYRILDRPITTILHRQSFTFVESKHGKTLSRYELALKDLFQGREALIPELVKRFLNADTSELFAEVEDKINIELNRLDRNLATVEPTLADGLAKRRKKIIYHIGNLRRKFYRAQYQKDESIRRQIETAYAALMPHDHLQERTLNVLSLLNHYGPYFIDWIYQATDLDDKGHRVISA
ncbi:MAG: bacillithiol biosynthesis cysteine-adding enzyme BshC [Acidobacteria bacterium]|nr:bacillithiol biosynthesis cysteine-adding enzyme BshC [Acidobacteriota bacterium]MBK8809122.1 bacillithiol biosynthesis cysteine-adding enzyme BshC [Acidobacteriota bacterium]